jgi:hypothetical protein
MKLYLSLLTVFALFGVHMAFMRFTSSNRKCYAVNHKQIIVSPVAMLKRNENLSKNMNSTQNKILNGNNNVTSVMLDKDEVEKEPSVEELRPSGTKGSTKGKASQAPTNGAIAYEETVEVAEVTETTAAVMSAGNSKLELYHEEDEDEGIEVLNANQLLTRLDSMRNDIREKLDVPPYQGVDDLDTESYEMIMDSSTDGSAHMFTFSRSPKFPGKLISQLDVF